MATVSRQSAFWGVVALGLNTLTQDGGKVLGFPAEYSRALRLSPIVCIVDTLGVLFSVAFFCDNTRSFKDGLRLAARYRGLTEEDRAEPKLERTWWFRFSVFAFGAMPQAVKMLSMDGIPLTKIWGMAYLVSFLVLESLDLLRPRQHIDYHALEMDVEEVLDGYLRLPGSLAVLSQRFCFLLQLSIIPKRLYSECVLKSGSSPPGFNNKDKFALISIGPLMACFALAVLTRGFLKVGKGISHRSKRNVAPLFEYLAKGGQIAFWLAAAWYYFFLFTILNSLEPTCSVRAAVAQVVATSLLLTSAALPFALDEKTFEYGWFRGFFGLIGWFRKLFGLRRLDKEEGNFSALYATPNIASIICYYMCIYDPSSTYKPPWTEYLG